ncbi:MAG: hypothetical protein ACE5JU_07350 [Candidatus Binatia bacterium]
MRNATVVFLHGLPQEIVALITSYTPEGFTTTVVDGKLPEEEQMEAVKEADFIIGYRVRHGTPGFAAPSSLTTTSSECGKVVLLLPPPRIMKDEHAGAMDPGGQSDAASAAASDRKWPCQSGSSCSNGTGTPLPVDILN